MKKILLTTVILGITILFIGCGNNLVKESIEQAEISMENKDYDKAIISLEIALEEDEKNEEANKLYKIVYNYEKAEEFVIENNFEDAKKSLDSIDEEYIYYAIKDDVDLLKNEVDNYYKEVEKVNVNVEEAQKLFNENKYTECEEYLFTNILGSEEGKIDENKYATEEQKEKALGLLDKCNKEIEEEKRREPKGTRDEYIKKLDMIEEGLDNLNYLYEGGITANLIEAEGEALRRWDAMLNEIYKLLKVQLPKSEMDDLTKKQINWIKYRDITAKNESDAFQGGTMGEVQYNSTLARLTKERCYELVNMYMK